MSDNYRPDREEEDREFYDGLSEEEFAEYMGRKREH